MKNNKRTKSGKKPKKYQHKETTPPIEPSPTNPNKKSTILRLINNGWFWFGVLSTLIASLQFKDIIITTFSNDQENYESQQFIKGILISDGFERSVDGLNVRLGGGGIRYIGLWELQTDGYDLWPIAFNVHRKPIHLYVKPETHKLYVSSDIIDIQTGQVIGTINYNEWKLFKPNLLNYSSNDTAFEVLDRYDNVVFSMKRSSSSTIDVRGYFLYDSNALVISDSKMQSIPYNNPNWRQVVMNEVKTIKRINQ